MKLGLGQAADEGELGFGSGHAASD